MTDSPRLMALVDAGNIAALLKIVTPQQVAETWMRYLRRYAPGDERPDDDPDRWAVEAWMTEQWWEDEARVRDGIVRLVGLADRDADFSIIGAAIQEEFVREDESRLLWIERQAASSESFRHSLANVYVWGDAPDAVAARVETAAQKRLPRPKDWTGP